MLCVPYAGFFLLLSPHSSAHTSKGTQKSALMIAHRSLGAHMSAHASFGAQTSAHPSLGAYTSTHMSLGEHTSAHMSGFFAPGSYLKDGE